MSSPMGELMEGDLMEEGEIVVHHPLPHSPSKQGGEGLQELMAIECDT